MEQSGLAATIFAIGNLGLAVFFTLSLLDDPLGVVSPTGLSRALWMGSAVIGIAGVSLGSLLGRRAYRRSGRR